MGLKGDDDICDYQIIKYIKKFGKSENFIKKILKSLSGKFAIINATTFEIEISNLDDLATEQNYHDIFKIEKKKIQEIIQERKSGSIITKNDETEEILETTCTPIINGAGEVVSIIIHQVNLTQKNDIQKRYKTLYENIEEGFLLNKIKKNEKDEITNIQILKANAIAKNILGENIEESEINEIIPNFLEKYKKCLNKLEEETSKNICIVNIQDKIIKILNIKINEEEFISILKDISKENKENSKFYEIEEKFYDILQNSQGLAYRYNFKTEKFEYVSESVFTILGYPLGEFMQMTIKDFSQKLHPEDKDKMDIKENFEKETNITVEYRFKKKNGNYVWIKAKRTIFRDENGELLYSIGDMQDITSEKIIEEERIKLEEKIEKITKEKIEHKEKLNLTNKEKLVLWGFCKNPNLNDEELANEINIKRSTITAIKNRLKEKKWYTKIYLPNFSKIGCEFISIIYGNLTNNPKAKTLDISTLKENPQIIFNNYQDDKFFSIFTSKKYSDFKKCIEKLKKNNKDFSRLNIEDATFFYNLDKIEIKDFSETIKKSLNIKINENSNVYQLCGEKEKMNANEKRVLSTIINYPEITSSEIAKKIWISKPTVIKAKKKMINENIIYPLILPNMKKLGFSYIGKITIKLEEKVPKEIKNYYGEPRTIIKIERENELTKFSFFKNEHEYMEEIEEIKDIFHKNGIYAQIENEIFPIQKRNLKLTMDNFIDEILFEEES